MRNGRASLIAQSGKESPPCDNCGTKHATMYTVGLSRRPGQELNLQWTLCVDCRSHLGGVFTEFDRTWKDID